MEAEAYSYQPSEATFRGNRGVPLNDIAISYNVHPSTTSRRVRRERTIKS